MSAFKKTHKKITSALLIAGLLFVSVSAGLLSQPPSKAEAATIPGGSVFTYVTDPTSQALAICQNTSNAGCSGVNSGGDIFDIEQGQSGGTNQAIFDGQSESGRGPQVTITVNGCNPSSGTFTEANLGVTNVPITISGFSAYASGGWLNCTSSSAPNGPQTVDVTANITNVPTSTISSGNPGSSTIGPLTVQLIYAESVVTTTTLPATTIGGTTNVSLTGMFTNVAPGSYAVCSPDMTGSGSCANVTVTNAKTGVVLNGPATAASYSATSTSGTPPDDCNTSLFSLSWLLCPFVAAMQAALTWLNNTITGLLTLPVNSYFNDGCLATPNQPSVATGKCVATATDYGVWSNIRDISLALLTIAALIMVISTAIDVGPFDAYTVKKLLPRILIAVIAITFSWEIGRFLVQLSNDLGEGVGQLILSALPIHLPAGTAATNANILSYIYNNNGTVGNGEGVIAWMAGGAVLGTLGLALVGPLALIMLILPAILAFFIGLLVLIARQLIVIMCVIFAPLAFMAFIMPGTQRVWKLWQQSFFGAIFLFPMITAVIAIGAFMAYLMMNGNINGYGTGIQPLLALIFLITPYFLIPRLARMSTGMLGTISTGINSASQGAFKGLKQMQRNKMAQSWANIKAGQRFKGGNNENFRGRVNRAMRGATLLPKAGLRPTQMRTKMRQALRDASGGEQLEDLMQGKNRSFNAWSGDDAKLYASRFNSREDMAAALEAFDADRFGGEQNRARREEAVAQIQETKRQVNSAALAKARVRMQAKTGTGYQYVDENGQTQFDANAVLEDINEAYGNDRNGAADTLADVRTSLQQSGQMAGAAGFADWATALEDRHNNVITGEQAHDRIMDAAIDAVTPGQAIYGKQGSAAALGHAHARRIQEIAQGVQAGTHTMDDLSAAMAGAAGIYDAMGQASPGNASAFANELFGEDVGMPPMSILDAAGNPVPIVPEGGRGGNANIREFIETQMAANPEFVNRRRDISQSTLERAQRWQQQQQQQAPGTTGPPTPPAQPQPPTPVS